MMMNISSFLLLSSLAVAGAFSTTARDLVPNPVCTQIANAISPASNVFFADSLGSSFPLDISHFALSSTQIPDCTIEPGTPSDVGVVLQILGSAKQSFAVKGGGHTMNPGFSSTQGVHISMSRFSDVTYDSGSQTATVGAGLLWDDVYEALEQFNVNVVGGRVTGVGLAGFTLGGGYSWKTNQFGLTIDTVNAYELVKPDGSVSNVTAESDADLFFALKGGLNNFGIVTRFTLQTHPQGLVWGGLMLFTANELDAVSDAVVTFTANVQDPKAAIITTYNFVLGEPGVSHLMFYDGPTPPDGIFDEFLSIPSLSEDVSTRTFLNFLQATPANVTSNQRGFFNAVTFSQYDASLLDAIMNETVFWGIRLAPLSASFISYQVEPFLPIAYQHNTSPSAYPVTRSETILPFNIYYAWDSSAFDSEIHDAITASATHLQAQQSSSSELSLYPNYALYDTALDRMYGTNVARLSEIRETVDPNNTMQLAGGFKL